MTAYSALGWANDRQATPNAPRRLAQLQNLQEQRAERLQMPLAEVVDGTKIRRIERHNHHKIVPLAAGPRDSPRRIQPTRIAVQQKRHHHPRVKRRLPKPAHIAARDLLEIEALPHQLNNKPRDMAFRYEVLHIRRQKQRLIDIPGAKIFAHGPKLNQTRSELNSDYSDGLLETPTNSLNPFWISRVDASQRSPSSVCRLVLAPFHPLTK